MATREQILVLAHVEVAETGGEPASTEAEQTVDPLFEEDIGSQVQFPYAAASWMETFRGKTALCHYWNGTEKKHSQKDFGIQPSRTQITEHHPTSLLRHLGHTHTHPKTSTTRHDISISSLGNATWNRASPGRNGLPTYPQDGEKWWSEMGLMNIQLIISLTLHVVCQLFMRWFSLL